VPRYPELPINLLRDFSHLGCESEWIGGSSPPMTVQYVGAPVAGGAGWVPIARRAKVGHFGEQPA
jgi:hypothetical protein